MLTTAVLKYEFDTEAPLSTNALLAKATSKLTIGPGGSLPDDLTQFGATQSAIALSLNGTKVHVEVTFALSALYNANFPAAGDPKAPLRDHYTHRIGQIMATPVTPLDPSVS